MADPFSDQDQSPGGVGKRPAQTIEGTATELSVEPESNAEARAEPESSSGRSEDRPYLAGATAEGGETEALPPPQTSLPELRSFVTHLAAGLLGGLVGVLALAFAWGGLDIGKESGPSPESAMIEQRLAKLEAAPLLPATPKRSPSSRRASKPSSRAPKRHRPSFPRLPRASPNSRRR